MGLDDMFSKLLMAIPEIAEAATAMEQNGTFWERRLQSLGREVSTAGRIVDVGLQMLAQKANRACPNQVIANINVVRIIQQGAGLPRLKILKGILKLCLNG
jgi:hypothetical protein